MKFAPEPTTTLQAAPFQRPELGCRPGLFSDALPLSGLAGWQSNGGPARAHPARACPYTLRVALDADGGELCRVYIVGVFAQWAGADHEGAGTLGAMVNILGGGEPLVRHSLVNGRHYGDARDLAPVCWVSGDGSSVETLGQVDIDGHPHRVDVLTLDVPSGVRADALEFKDLGSPASFHVCDVIVERREPRGCPFRTHGGSVSLAELGGIVRTGDRVRLSAGVRQLQDGMRQAGDLDEARGQALTFHAVVTAAMLEAGGARSLHSAQLQAARALEAASTLEEVVTIAAEQIEGLVAPLMVGPEGPAGQLVDRALAIVERHFAINLTDAGIAQKLGLSTSHFRFLFKQATGQPFHRYLVSVRLEKAHRLLVEESMSVSEVAEAVGFAGLSHFSRAFAARFQTNPARVRRRR